VQFSKKTLSRAYWSFPDERCVLFLSRKCADFLWPWASLFCPSAIGAKRHHIPHENIGIIVLSNTTPIGVPESIALTFMDLFQRGKLRVSDWFAAVSPPFKRMTDDVENASPNYSKMPSSGSPSPGAPLGSYVGRYFNRYYGTVEIVKERDSLAMLLPPFGQHYDLQQWDGDTFTTTLHVNHLLSAAAE
jgi:hypothetical protein